MKRYLIGIDNGGTVTKCAVYDLDGRELAVDAERVPLIEPHPGWVERDLDLVWDANIRAVRGAVKKAGIAQSEILAIGLTGYGNGVCLVDRNGRPVHNAVVSSDNRASALCQRLVGEGIQERIYPLTCQEFWAAQTAVLLKWFDEQLPDVLARAEKVLSIKDYVRMKLTDQYCYELTETTCNGLMNIHNRTFDPFIFATLGISGCMEKMPEYTGITDISGRVTKRAAAKTGIAEGTPVAGSCYDVNACALASGILDDHTLCMIAGSWTINEYLTQTLVENANSIALSYLDGYYILEESSPTSTNNFEWFIDHMLSGKAGTDRGAVYRECDRMVGEIAPEESGLIFIPYLFASATHPDAKGAFLNLTSFHDERHLTRAVYEGIAFSSMLHIKRLMKDGKTFSTAKLSGGITKSGVWPQMICDILQMPLEISAVSEPGALGAAICAAIAGGAYDGYEAAVENMVHMEQGYVPDQRKREIYREKFARYEKALKALDAFYSE